MPQMYPLNWLFLFILFLMIFIMFNVMNYFSIHNNKMKMLNNNNNNKLMNSLNWKW